MKNRRAKKWLSRLWKILLLLVVAALVILALQPEPVPADIVVVREGPMMVTLDHEGKTRVRNRFVVSATLAGIAHRIELEPGDRVRKGSVLTVIEAQVAQLLDVRTRVEAEARVRSAESVLQQARAERARLEAELRQAQLDFDRSSELLEKGVIARSVFDESKSRLEVLRESVEAAGAAIQTAAFELEAARARLLEPASEGDPASGEKSLVPIYSPIDGVVLKRFRESAGPVAQGEALLEIADLAGLEVVADYLSRDAVTVRPGMPVVIDRWGGENSLKGKVRRVEPGGFMKISALGVEEQRVNVVVDFEDPREGWERLGDEYRVEVRIVLWETERTLLAPTGAIFREGDGWAVFAVREAVAQLRPVQIGHRNSRWVEVVDGLESGESVIAYPSDRISDGVAVEGRSANSG